MRTDRKILVQLQIEINQPKTSGKLARIDRKDNKDVCGKTTEEAQPRTPAPVEAAEGLDAHHRHRRAHGG